MTGGTVRTVSWFETRVDSEITQNTAVVEATSTDPDNEVVGVETPQGWFTPDSWVLKRTNLMALIDEDRYARSQEQGQENQNQV